MTRTRAPASDKQQLRVRLRGAAEERHNEPDRDPSRLGSKTHRGTVFKPCRSASR